MTSETHMEYTRKNNYDALKRMMLNVDIIEVDLAIDMADPKESFMQSVDKGLNWQVSLLFICHIFVIEAI